MVNNRIVDIISRIIEIHHPETYEPKASNNIPVRGGLKKLNAMETGTTRPLILPRFSFPK